MFAVETDNPNESSGNLMDSQTVNGEVPEQIIQDTEMDEGNNVTEFYLCETLLNPLSLAQGSFSPTEISINLFISYV